MPVLFEAFRLNDQTGDSGPSPELIAAIVEMKRRNPRFGRRRIIGFAVQPGAVDGPALCRTFNQVIARAPALPHSESVDVKLLRSLEQENTKLKKLLAESA